MLERLPKTANGKIDRDALPEPNAAAAPAIARSRIEPRDELERQLARIWAAVLEIPEPGVTEDFFELGGHSLLAARLFTGIEEQTGKHIPLATLFRAPTIEQLANTIRGDDWKAAFLPVVELQTGGANPFFCVHSLGANLVSYKRLSTMLGSDQPFFGLQPHGLDGEQAPHTSLEDMAADYLREIRGIQPRGPYNLGGVCLGGVVAFEMAQQLRAAGERTGLLLMIDSEYPGQPEYQHVRSYRTFLADWHLGEFLRMNGRERMRYARKKLGNGLVRARERLGVQPQGGSLARAVQNIRAANLRALLSYAPQPYDDKVTMFWSGDTPARCYEDRRLSWSSIVRGGLEVHVIPGDHMTMIEPPHVEVMARELRMCIERARVQHPIT